MIRIDIIIIQKSCWFRPSEYNVPSKNIQGLKIEKAFFGTGFVFRKDDGDANAMLNYMAKNGYRHHVAFVRGSWSATIVEAFSNYLGYDVERV